MFATVLTALALLLLVPLAPTSAASFELVTNGGFEAGAQPKGWRVDVWEGEAHDEVDAAVAHSGQHSLHLAGDNDKGLIVANQRFTLLTGAPVTLSGYWKAALAQGTGARVVLRWTDAAGEKVRDETPLTKTGAFDWERFELTVTPPEGAAAISLFLEIWRTRGDVWFDDVSAVQEIEPPAPDAFEVGRSPDVITVGVFDAGAAGGRGFGAQGIQDVLAAADGIHSELITDAS
ncbi:MAG: hypothetical protein J7M38_02955, partial [Armatimonadetes bacterium]|nr:hypothetical protein [Armatimonadota bacterium]